GGSSGLIAFPRL
uniref:Periviscerokinin-2 n=2 Tax=Paramantini TaxID=627846 RepID=PVK2_SPHVI|nr:RecName: Full=Periviscerokinin-2; Short=Sphvi-PVK-2 [Sphodromantis viridis]